MSIYLFRLRWYLAQLALLSALPLARFTRTVFGTRSRGWLTEHHYVKPSLLRRGVQLSISVLLVMVIIGLTQAHQIPSAQLATQSKQYTLGAPCSTLTDIREGTCNLKVDAIKRNAGQPKPFTERWTK